MRYRFTTLVLFALLGGCGGGDGKSFSVFFQPYSADLDPRAQETVHAAATFANAHPLMPVSIAGYTPSQGFNVDTTSGQRAEVVQNALVREGVGRLRIEIVGSDRLIDPTGLPNLPVGRVDINVGL